MNQQEPIEPVSKPTSSKKSNLLSVISLLIAIVAILLVLYLCQRNQIINSKLITMQEQLESAAANQTTINNQLNKASQLINKQAQLTKINQITINKLLASIGTDKDLWLLTEADHLLKLANLTLSYEYNIPSAVALLKTADQRLYAMNNPKLVPIRQMIANDIVKLQAVPAVDVTGIYLQLEALRTQSLQLPLVTNTYQSNTIDNLLSQQSTTSQAWWKKAIVAAEHALGKVLIIRQRATPIEPLLSPQQNLLLLQNIYLLYSQAEWAVLNRQQAVYEDSLAQLNNFISKYFLANTAQQTILQTLATLKTNNIAPTVPDISDTLVALNNYQKQAKIVKIKKSTLLPKPAVKQLPVVNGNKP